MIYHSRKGTLYSLDHYKKVYFEVLGTKTCIFGEISDYLSHEIEVLPFPDQGSETSNNVRGEAEGRRFTVWLYERIKGGVTGASWTDFKNNQRQLPLLSGERDYYD